MSTGERTLFVSTSNGAFRASGNGRGWSADDLGLPPTGGMRAAVVADKDNPRRLYAGTSRAGAFRSEDGGGTWREQVAQCSVISCPLWPIRPAPNSGPYANPPRDPATVTPEWRRRPLGWANPGDPAAPEQQSEGDEQLPCHPGGGK